MNDLPNVSEITNFFQHVKTCKNKDQIYFFFRKIDLPTLNKILKEFFHFYEIRSFLYEKGTLRSVSMYKKIHFGIPYKFERFRLFDKNVFSIIRSFLVL